MDVTRQNYPYHLSRTLSAARAPPCGGLMTEPDRVFACDVIVDDSSRVLCPAAARDRAIKEIFPYWSSPLPGAASSNMGISL